MSPHLQRARILVDQERFDQAIKELQQAVAQTPNDAECFALFAICYCELDEYQKAEEAAQQAIALEPDEPFGYYVASLVLLDRGKPKPALTMIERAIELDPYDPRFFGQLGTIQIATRDWQDALDSAEQGLDLDPEHVHCQNLRALALNRLGRREEAGATISSTLKQAPDDAFSHANMGWELLHRGEAKEALPHFKEALRLEPEMEYARQGVIEAMKGRYLVYRLFLKWLMLCNRLKAQYLFAIILGGYIGYRVCLSLVQSNPALKPVLIPLIVLYVAFVIMTWISMPLFNLLLRTNKYGRMVLSDQEKRTSTWVGVALFGAVAGVVCWLVIGELTFAAFSISIALTIPAIATYYNSSEGWPRVLHAQLIILLGGLCLLMTIGLLGSLFAEGAFGFAFMEIAELCLYPYFYTAFGSQFAVNFLGVARPTRGTNLARKAWLVGGPLLALILGGMAWLCGSKLVQAGTDPAAFLNRLQAATLQELDQSSFELVDQSVWNNDSLIEELTQAFQAAGFVYAGDVETDWEFTGSTRYLLQQEGVLVGMVSETDDFDQPEVIVAAVSSEGKLVGVINEPEIHDEDGMSLFPTEWDLVPADGRQVGEWIAHAQSRVESVAATRLKQQEIAGFQKAITRQAVQHVLQNAIEAAAK